MKVPSRRFLHPGFIMPHSPSSRIDEPSPAKKIAARFQAISADARYEHIVDAIEKTQRSGLTEERLNSEHEKRKARHSRFSFRSKNSLRFL
jgi:hypothetical protein